MKLEFGFLKQQKAGDGTDGLGGGREGENKPEEKKDDFLMSVNKLDSMRFGAKTPEKNEFIKNLDQKIDKITGSFKLHIFDNLKEHKDDANWQLGDIFEEEANNILAEGIDLNTKLIDIPEEILGEILKPMSKEARQLIYVQRNVITMENALKAYMMWIKGGEIAFHVSPHEINGKLGEKGEPIFFSKDIKRLFDQREAKYIYAFRISNKTANISRYDGAPGYFGKLAAPGGFEIEDSIKIFNESDPAYRVKAMAEIGANFDKTYKPANRSGDEYIQ